MGGIGDYWQKQGCVCGECLAASAKIHAPKPPKEKSLDEVLKEAEDRDPGNKFVASCRDYYEKYGKLTELQVKALNKVSRTVNKYDNYFSKARQDGEELYDELYDDYYRWGDLF